MFLGIDLGTSELKVLLVDERQRTVAVVSEPLALQRPQPTWSEQEPAAWWAALDAALLRLAAAQPAALRAVRAIGLAGQMHGAVLLDAADRVLRPAILWNDGRSAAECVALEAALPRLREIAGNIAMPGFTAPKLAWLRTHEPALFAQVATVLLPKDWLRLGLSGERVSEMSDASGTLWLDVGARRWSAELLAATGLGIGQMPRLVEGSDISGTLRAPLAARWGLPAGVPVAGGGGDNAASAVGIGAVRAGQGFVSLGTSGVVFVVSDRHAPNPTAAVHAFCHALPRRWHGMSVMLSAASALRWARQLLGLPDEAALLDAIATLTPAARAAAPIFLPYLSGERTPHNDVAASGVLFGLRHDHGAAAVGYAVVEGVGFGLADGWRALNTDAASLWLVGGGARSVLWADLLASALGVALDVGADAQAGGALGAARLAMLAGGASEDDVCRPPAAERRHEPDAATVALLAPRHARFRALYPALRGQFAAAAEPALGEPRGQAAEAA